MNTLSEMFESVWNDLREGVSEVLNLVEDAIDSDPSAYRGDVGETEVSPDEHVDAQANHMTEEQYRREMWHWGRRVRRDIVALETWVMSRDPSFKPGLPDVEEPASDDHDVNGTPSDSGDAPGGLQDEL
jgi:hypothetical protein